MASGIQSIGTNTAANNAARQLNFQKAMSDFKCMFPSIDIDVIEMVLRANNGLVDATVDQLLTLQDEQQTVSTENGLLDPDLNVRLPSYDDSSSVHSTNEPPPAYTPRVENDPNFVYDPTFLSPALGSFVTPNHSQTTEVKSDNRTTGWNPPILGNLPKDFLRINLNDQSEQQRQQHWRASHDSQHSSGLASSRYPESHNPTSSPQNVAGRTPLSRAEGRHKSHCHRQNVNGFDAIPDRSETKPKSSESKSKKFGQMSRKFKRTKKTKCPKNEHKPIAFENLVDEDSSDDGNPKNKSKR